MNVTTLAITRRSLAIPLRAVTLKIGVSSPVVQNAMASSAAVILLGLLSNAIIGGFRLWAGAVTLVWVSFFRKSDVSSLSVMGLGVILSFWRAFSARRAIR